MTDQLEVQFDGGIVDIKASGAWEATGSHIAQMLDRRGFLRVSAVGLLGAAGLAAGCGSGGATSTAGGASGGGAIGEGKTIALSLNGLAEYDECIATGVLKTLEGTKYKFVGRQANFSPPTELSNIQDLVTQRVTGLLVLPNTVQSASRGATMAKAAGIPVVNLVWVSPTSADDAYVGVVRTDNIKGGSIIAGYLRQSVPTASKIVLVEGVPGQGFSEELLAGIRKAVGSDYTIAAAQPGNYSRSDAITAAQTMLTAHPDARAIVTFAAVMGDGVASFLKETGRTDVVHISSEADLETPRWIAAGYTRASRYFLAAQTGTIGTGILRDYLEKGKRPAQFVTEQPQRLVTAKDLAKNAPVGVINPNLTGASGTFCYHEYMGQAKAI